MREDIPHPDKRTSLRVVLEGSPVYSRRFSRNLKRDSLRSPSSLPGASRDGLGLTVVSLPCPKGCIFWCGSWGRERTQTTHKAAGVDNGLRRLRWSSSKGVLRPLQPHSWCPHTREETGKKKSAANVTKGWHIYPPVIYCICWRATRFFDWPLRTTYHFSRLRGLRVLYFPYLRVLWISPLMCSPIINSPCPLQHHLSKDNVTEGWHPPPSVI